MKETGSSVKPVTVTVKTASLEIVGLTETLLIEIVGAASAFVIVAVPWSVLPVAAILVPLLKLTKKSSVG